MAAKQRKTRQFTDAELIKILKKRRDSGLNGEDSAVSIRRQNNLDRYLGRKYGDERVGQSQVRTRQCMEAVEWSLPSLLRVFASSNKIVEFEPEGPEDELGALQESEGVNRVFVKDCNGFQQMFYFLKALLMYPVVYWKIFWEPAEERATEVYEGLLDVELEELLAGEGVEPVESDERTKAVETEVGLIPVTVYDVKIVRTKKTGKPVVSIVPPEELTIDGKVTEVSVENADFISHKTALSRSTLIARGYDKEAVMALPTADTEEDDEKNHRFDASGAEAYERGDANDPASELVTVYDDLVTLDLDGDGIAERRHILWAGSTIFENEEIDYNPYVAASAVPMPFTHVGLAWQELVEDLQQIYTTFMRQLFNNMYRMNNPRPLVGRGINMSDVLNDLPGSPIRVTGDINNYRYEPIAPIIGQVLPAFEMLDGQRDSRIGISRSTMGLDADSLSRVTKGAFLGALEQSNQRLELLARVIAEFAFKPLFLKLHQLLLTHQTEAIMTKVKGEWVPVSPSEWRERKNMTVQVGLGTGNKQAQAEALNRILELQAAVKDRGLPLVAEQHVYNAAADMVKLVGMANPEKYFYDPSKNQLEAPPPALGEEDALAAAQMELAKVEREKAQLKYQTDMAALQAKMADMQQKLQAKIAELQAKIAKDDRELNIKEHEAIRKDHELMMKTELEQAKIVQTEMHELDKQQAAADADLRQWGM